MGAWEGWEHLIFFPHSRCLAHEPNHAKAAPLHPYYSMSPPSLLQYVDGAQFLPKRCDAINL